MMRKLSLLLLSSVLISCTSMQAYNTLNSNAPEEIARGDPDNPVRVENYLMGILDNPEGYTVKAYERRAYSPNNKKTVWVVHSFYAFFKDDKMEHTLVFTATPRGSELNGCWMLDAETDVESYNLYLSSKNIWEVEEYKGKHGEGLNLTKTSAGILKRLREKRTFFGASSARDLAWYHQVWMWLVPPPVLTYGPLLLMSIGADNCTSAVIETMVWEY